MLDLVSCGAPGRHQELLTQDYTVFLLKRHFFSMIKTLGAPLAPLFAPLTARPEELDWCDHFELRGNS